MAEREGFELTSPRAARIASEGKSRVEPPETAEFRRGFRHDSTATDYSCLQCAVCSALAPLSRHAYNVPTLRGHIMKSVNVRQLKNNPSDALRMAREAPVIVMNRDRPEALLFHLDDEGLLGEPGVRLALATALYRSESVTLGRGAKIAGVPLVDFMQHVS